MKTSINFRAIIVPLAVVAVMFPQLVQAVHYHYETKCTNNCSTCNDPEVVCYQVLVADSQINILQGSMEDGYQVFSSRIGGPGSLNLTLTYSSRSAEQELLSADNTSLGFGWAHSYERFLFRQQAAMYRRDGQGGILQFTRQPGTNSPTLYLPSTGFFETMTGNTNGTFSINYPDGTVEQFTNFPNCPYFFRSPIYQMTERVDRNGNKTTLAYDATGRLITVTSPYGQTLTFSYDANNRVQTITDPLGRVTQFAYSAFGAALLQITDPLGYAVSYEYDIRYCVTKKTHKNGGISFYTKGNGSLTAEYLNPNGTRTFLGSVANTNGWAINDTLLATQLKTEYLPSSVIELDARSNRWVFTYDKNAYPTNILPPGQSTGKTYTFDPDTLRTTSVTDANGNTTYRFYDARGNRLAETNCLGQVTRSTYETNFNQVTSVTDPNGFVTIYSYDSHGNRTNEVDALGFTRSWAYDTHGNILTEKDKNGNITHYYYDQFGNRTNTTDALGNVTSFNYDAADNLLSRTDANGHTSSYGYDALNRLVAETNATSLSPLAPSSGQSPPSLQVEKLSDGSIQLSWDAPGFVLTRTASLACPFEPVLLTGGLAAVSPFVISAPQQNSAEFFRLEDSLTASGVNGSPPKGPSPILAVTHYTYDAEGDRTTVTDANGHTTYYAYDQRKQLTYTTNALGGITANTYDAARNITSRTDANGHTTWFAYDSQNRLAAITNALGYGTTYAYDAVGNKIVETDANGHTNIFAYDCLNRLNATTNALGYITRYEYDAGPGGGGCGCGSGTKATGRIIKQTDANGKVTYFKYDQLGRLVTTIRKQGDTADLIDADDAVTTYAYDPNGNGLTATTRINATDYLTNYFGYDALNRQVATINAAGDTTLTSYDPVGNVLITISPNGNIITNTYDSLNRLIQVDDKIGRVASYGYDAMGNWLFMTDGNTNTIQYAYDPLNRLVAATDAMGSTSTNYYDPVGNLIKVTDRMTNFSLYAYDAMNRRTNTTDALGNVTAYAYDGMGNLLAITDANNHTTAYQYDALNRQVRETYPDSPADTRTFTYDGVGNPASRTDQMGNTTLYLYSDLYYLTNRIYASDPPDRFTYDLGGRMLTANKTNWLTTNDWLLTFVYDAANRVTNTTQGGRTIAYAYDIRGRTQSLTYPSETNLVLLTDARGRLLAVNDGVATPVATYTYDLDDQPFTRTYRNGSVATFAYNANDWVTNLVHTAGTDLIAGFDYAYDNEGNKKFELKRHLPADSEAYAYDADYRLTNWLTGQLVNGTVPTPAKSEQWQLDRLGNWRAWITNSVTQIRVHNAANELTMIGGSALSYDANGNLRADEYLNFSYDQENRLIQVVRNSDDTIVGQYSYDALGRRVQKIANPAGVPSTILNFYDEARIIEEQNAFGVIQATYIYGNYVDEVLTMNRAGQTYYYHPNALFSVEALTDSTGTPVERYAYDAYGLVTVTDGLGNPVPPNAWGTPHSAFANPYVFTGRQLDEETGLLFYRVRYNDSGKGRFLQRDPLQYAGGMNLYEYVMDNPVESVDPSGLAAGGATMASDQTDVLGATLPDAYNLINGGEIRGPKPKPDPNPNPKPKPDPKPGPKPKPGPNPNNNGTGGGSNQPPNSILRISTSKCDWNGDKCYDNPGPGCGPVVLTPGPPVMVISCQCGGGGGTGTGTGGTGTGGTGTGGTGTGNGGTGTGNGGFTPPPGWVPGRYGGWVPPDQVK